MISNMMSSSVLSLLMTSGNAALLLGQGINKDFSSLVNDTQAAHNNSILP